MARGLRNIESIRPKREIKSWLTVFDFIFIVGATLLAWVIRGMVYPAFEWVFILYTFLAAFFLTREPKGNPGMRNYQVMLLSFRWWFYKEYQVHQSVEPKQFETD